MSFVFIILAELALHAVLLFGQLVFRIYALIGTPKLNYECGLVVGVLDFGSDFHGFDDFLSVPDIILSYNIHDIFSILYCINRVIDYLYFL